MNSDELARWLFVLKNPARLRLLRLLGERGPLPFKELRRELGLGVGTIYYHLSIMSELVAQDGRKRYYLSEQGRRLYRALEDGTLTSLVPRHTPGERVLKALLLAPLMRLACEKRAFGLPAAVLITLIGAYGCSRARLMPVLFFYVRTSAACPYLLFAHYMGQLFLVFLICEGLCLLFLRRRGAELELLIGIGLASLPMAIFPYIYMLVPYDVAVRVLPILHLWSILLTCSAVSLGKGVRLDRALPVGLVLLFLNVLLLSSLGLLTF